MPSMMTIFYINPVVNQHFVQSVQQIHGNQSRTIDVLVAPGLMNQMIQSKLMESEIIAVR